MQGSEQRFELGLELGLELRLDPVHVQYFTYSITQQ